MFFLLYIAIAVDSYSKGQMIALGITFLILPCIFVGLRFWAKWLQRRALQWDDLCIFLGLVKPIIIAPFQQTFNAKRADLFSRMLHNPTYRYTPQ
jgi:hypothetical protein